MAATTDTVRVRFFSVLRERAGVGGVELSADDVGSVEQVADAVFERFPQLVPYRRVVRYARNLAYAAPGEPVGPGDEIALITPVSGG